MKSVPRTLIILIGIALFIALGLLVVQQVGQTDSDPFPASAAQNGEQASPSSEIGLATGLIAPDFTTTTATGDRVRLSQYRGAVVLLNFWATWCGPCRIEMPEFQSAYEQYVDQGLVIVAVNNGETLEDIVGFRDELALTFSLALDERALIQREYGIVSYPSTFLLDRDGRILARHFGPLTTTQTHELLTLAGLS